ncbi:MAG TPA: hypothetical protein PLP56_05070, partial [Candidatus Omnitrophota bacterium]|nr:hypothetical protein [Candidatus Omnitrophota bacterium]
MRISSQRTIQHLLYRMNSLRAEIRLHERPATTAYFAAQRIIAQEGDNARAELIGGIGDYHLAAARNIQSPCRLRCRYNRHLQRHRFEYFDFQPRAEPDRN